MAQTYLRDIDQNVLVEYTPSFISNNTDGDDFFLNSGYLPWKEY